MNRLAGYGKSEGSLLVQVARLVSEPAGCLTPDILVQRLASMLQSEYFFLAEMDPPGRRRLRVLACWRDGLVSRDEELDLNESLRLHVRDRNGWCFPERAWEYSPVASLYGDVPFESCAGVPIVNGRGLMIGILGVASRRPFADPEAVRSVLQIVAPRAVVELERRPPAEKPAAAENYSSLLLEDCQDAITLLSPTGERLYSSPTAATLLGYPLEVYASQSTFDTVHPADAERVRKLFAELVSQPGHRISVEIRCRHFDGSWRWIHTNSVNLLDQPEVGALVCTWRDVTRQREAETALRAEEARFRGLVANIPGAVYRCEFQPGGVLQYLSDGIEAITGYPASDYLGAARRTFLDLIHPEDQERIVAETLRTVGTGEPFVLEYRTLHRSGELRWIRSRGRVECAEDGTPLWVDGVLFDDTARREAEEALRCSEARFRALVERASDVVGVVDADGFIRYESPAIEQIMGYTAAELDGVYAFDLIHPDDLPQVLAAFERLVGNPGLTLAVTYRVRHRDGSWRLLASTATSLLDQPGVRGIVVNARDRTEQQAAEEQARFQSAVLEALKEATQEGVLLVSPTGEVLTCNRRFQELWKLPDAALANRKEQDALDLAVQLLDEPEAFQQRVLELMRTQEISDEEIALRDGRVLERYGAPVRGEDGTLYGRVWRFRDITERKRAQQKDLAFQRLGQELNTAATPEAAARVVLRVADELLGWDACWLDLFSDEPRSTMTLVFQDIVDGKRVDVPVPTGRTGPSPMAREAIEKGALLILHEPGSLPAPDAFGCVPFGDVNRTSASILCVPIRSGERIIGAVSVQSYTFHAYDEASLATFQALTDYCGGALERTLSEAARQKLEQQLVQAQKMEAVGRLAGGVAHDFNNMLAVIGGYSELLLMSAPPGHSMNGPLEQIRKAGERAARLTQQLLAFSRKQILQPQVLSLNDVVLGVDRMLRRLIGEDIELVTLGDPTVSRIEADPGQIEQVLLNLAVNARDAMPQGGKLTIQTRNFFVDEELAGRAPDARPGPYVQLSVSDTGCGMDAETLARIFEPFFTTKALGKGTGLGLSTVYGIVSQSEGFMQVQSAPNQGTTFYLHFPAVDRISPLAGVPETELPQGAGALETVLVVEDETMVRDLIRRVLETCGYEVLEAMQGEEALRTAEAHPGPIHLLLTDVVMPRMSGRELAEQFRQLRPDTQVLFMSGYTDDAVLRHGLAGKEASFLQKPFSPHVLARTVGELLRP